MRLLEKAKKEHPEDEKINLKFSNGWMGAVQAQTGLKFKLVHVEGASAYLEGAVHSLPTLQEKMQRFLRRSVD